MKKTSLVIYGLVLLIALFSCSKKDSAGINDLQYNLINYEKQSKGCEGLREDNCAKIKIEFIKTKTSRRFRIKMV